MEEQTKQGPSSCTIIVGVAPNQTLDTISDIEEVHGGIPVADPCAEGRRVVEAIVADLPPL